MPLTQSDQTAPPLLWLHGFTQTGRSAHQFLSILTAQRTVLVPDLPRHGDRFNLGGSLDEIADLLASTLPNGAVDVGGYSFGARVALHLALGHPEKVRRLVLLSGTRGIFDEGERAERRRRDEILARRVEELGADGFIEEWLSQPMFCALSDEPIEKATRAGQHAQSLAASLREAGTGTQRWLGEELRSLRPRVAVLAGAADERFAREALAISLATPTGSFQLVPGAGHAAHIQRPKWVAAVVQQFLNESVNNEARDDEQEPQK